MLGAENAKITKSSMISAFEELTVSQKLLTEGGDRYVQGSVAPKERPAARGPGAWVREGDT